MCIEVKLKSTCALYCQVIQACSTSFFKVFFHQHDLNCVSKCSVEATINSGCLLSLPNMKHEHYFCSHKIILLNLDSFSFLLGEKLKRHSACCDLCLNYSAWPDNSGDIYFVEFTFP